MSRNVVTFHYTLRDTQGVVIDASVGGEPITFLEGAGQIVEGLEEGLRGLAVGTQAKIGVPAAKAYGEHDESQVQRVLRSLLPIEGDVKPGDQFRAGSDAYAPIVTVRGVEGEELLLDANHPLAGVDLEFEVELLAVRVATAEELEHGHAHGEGGCCGGEGHGECGGSGECAHEGHDHGHEHGHGEAKGDCGKHDCGCKG